MGTSHKSVPYRVTASAPHIFEWLWPPLGLLRAMEVWSSGGAAAKLSQEVARLNERLGSVEQHEEGERVVERDTGKVGGRRERDGDVARGDGEGWRTSPFAPDRPSWRRAGGLFPTRAAATLAIRPPSRGLTQLPSPQGRYPGPGWRSAGTPTRDLRTRLAPSPHAPSERAQEARCGKSRTVEGAVPAPPAARRGANGRGDQAELPTAGPVATVTHRNTLVGAESIRVARSARYRPPKQATRGEPWERLTSQCRTA